MKITKQVFFSISSKRSKWLSYKLKKEKNRNIILSLQNKQKVEKIKNEDLKEIVKNFYEELYSTAEVPKEEVEKYLKDIEIKKLQKYQKKKIE